MSLPPLTAAAEAAPPQPHHYPFATIKPFPLPRPVISMVRVREMMQGAQAIGLSMRWELTIPKLSNDRAAEAAPPQPPQDSFSKTVVKGFTGGLVAGYIIKPFLWMKNRAQENARQMSAAPLPRPVMSMVRLREMMQGAHAIALSTSWELGVPKLLSDRIERATDRRLSPDAAKLAGAGLAGALTAPIVHVSELWNAQLEILFKTHGKMSIRQLHTHLVRAYGWRVYTAALHASIFREIGSSGTVFGTSEIAPHYIPNLVLSNAVCSFAAAVATQGIDTFKTRRQQNPLWRAPLLKQLVAPGSQAGLIPRFFIIMGCTTGVHLTNRAIDRVI